jgi:hypothetical protein
MLATADAAESAQHGETLAKARAFAGKHNKA